MSRTRPIPALVPAQTQPGARRLRTLVLCFDGTTNQYGPQNTNVVKIFGALRKQSTAAGDLPLDQAVYYQPGIGTYGPVGSSGIALLLDSAFAIYLKQHVLGGYRFLMQAYQPGDKIVMFGFSRGAYTAIALAEMLCQVGLLPADNEDHVTFAYEAFKELNKKTTKDRRREKKLFEARQNKIPFRQTISKAFVKKNEGGPDPKLTQGYHDTVPVASGMSANESEEERSGSRKKAKKRLTFKKLFSREITIDFIGLWDAVDSVGFFPRRFNLTADNPKVLNLRHALALQERRVKFQPSLWNIKHFTESPEHQPLNAQSIRQVWFAGGHKDVGGGNTDDAVECALSHITLGWMMREATDKVPTLCWDLDVLKDLRIEDPHKYHSEEPQVLQQTKKRFQGNASSPAYFAWFGPKASIWSIIWWHILELFHHFAPRPLHTGAGSCQVMIHASILERIHGEISKDPKTPNNPETSKDGTPEDLKTSKDSGMSKSPTYRFLRKRLENLVEAHEIWVIDHWLLSDAQGVEEITKKFVDELRVNILPPQTLVRPPPPSDALADCPLCTGKGWELGNRAAAALHLANIMPEALDVGYSLADRLRNGLKSREVHPLMSEKSRAALLAAIKIPSGNCSAHSGYNTDSDFNPYYGYGNYPSGITPISMSGNWPSYYQILGEKPNFM